MIGKPMVYARTTVIVEDDFLIASYLEQLCEEMDVEVVGTATGADEAIRVIRETRPGYVLMDLRLNSQRDGVDVAREIYGEQPEQKVIFITGSNEPRSIARIKNDNPHRILIKPIGPEALREAFG